MSTYNLNLTAEDKKILELIIENQLQIHKNLLDDNFNGKWDATFEHKHWESMYRMIDSHSRFLCHEQIIFENGGITARIMNQFLDKKQEIRALFFQRFSEFKTKIQTND